MSNNYIAFPLAFCFLGCCLQSKVWSTENSQLCSLKLLTKPESPQAPQSFISPQPWKFGLYIGFLSSLDGGTRTQSGFSDSSELGLQLGSQNYPNAVRNWIFFPWIRAVQLSHSSVPVLSWGQEASISHFSRAFVMPWAMPLGAKLGKDKKRIKCLLFSCLDLGCE